MTNLDSILKSRDIPLPTKVHIVKAVSSSSHVWLLELDHKKRLSAKELMFSNCGAREDSWESIGEIKARRSKQSILKEINPEYSLEGMMLKLKLQYFGHLMQRANSLEKTLMLGRIEGKRRREWQRMRWLDSITDSMDMNLSNYSRYWRTRAWRAAVQEVAKSRTQLSHWTIANWFSMLHKKLPQK